MMRRPYAGVGRAVSRSPFEREHVTAVDPPVRAGAAGIGDAYRRHGQTYGTAVRCRWRYPLYIEFRPHCHTETPHVVAEVAVAQECVGQLRQLYAIPAALVGYEEGGASHVYRFFSDPSGWFGFPLLAVHLRHCQHNA